MRQFERFAKSTRTLCIEDHQVPLVILALLRCLSTRCVPLVLKSGQSLVSYWATLYGQEKDFFQEELANLHASLVR
jgi:hypothetical protein